MLATNLTLNNVKGQGHNAVQLEWSYHKDHAYQVNAISSLPKEISYAKVF